MQQLKKKKKSMNNTQEHKLISTHFAQSYSATRGRTKGKITVYLQVSKVCNGNAIY